MGIVESNEELAQRYSDQHGFSMKIVYKTIEEMILDAAIRSAKAKKTIEWND